MVFVEIKFEAQRINRQQLDNLSGESINSLLGCICTNAANIWLHPVVGLLVFPGIPRKGSGALAGNVRGFKPPTGSQVIPARQAEWKRKSRLGVS